MPRGDGTGPWGAGPMTGRGLGYCPSYGTRAFGPGPRRAWRRGGYAGRFWGAALPDAEEERAFLQKQLGAVQANLAALDKLIEERRK